MHLLLYLASISTISFLLQNMNLFFSHLLTIIYNLIHIISAVAQLISQGPLIFSPSSLIPPVETDCPLAIEGLWPNICFAVFSTFSFSFFLYLHVAFSVPLEFKFFFFYPLFCLTIYSISFLRKFA